MESAVPNTAFSFLRSILLYQVGNKLDIKKSFLDFLLKETNKVDNVDLVEAIHMFDLMQLFYGMAFDIPVLNQTKLLKVQRIRNRLHFREIKAIIKEAERKDIKVVFFKGLFVALDLYSVCETRKTYDIDILIERDDFETLKEILLNNGFQELQKPWKEIRAINHFSFVKLYKSFWAIEIEVHFEICNPPYIYSALTAYFYENAKRQLIKGVNIFLFELYDRIIYYIIHFNMHLFNGFLSHCIIGEDEPCRLQILYEICESIYKYRLSEKEVLSKIHMLGLEFDAYIACRSINEIIPNFFTDSFLSDLYNNFHDSQIYESTFWKRFILNDFSILKLLLKNKKNFFTKGMSLQEPIKITKFRNIILSFQSDDLFCNMYIMKQIKKIVLDIKIRAPVCSWTDIWLIASIYSASFEQNNGACLKRISLYFDSMNDKIIPHIEDEHGKSLSLEVKPVSLSKGGFEIRVYFPIKYIHLAPIAFSCFLLYNEHNKYVDICITKEEWKDISKMIALNF